MLELSKTILLKLSSLIGFESIFIGIVMVIGIIIILGIIWLLFPKLFFLKRRKKLIDPKFQLKTTFKIIGIISIFFIILTGGMSVIIILNNQDSGVVINSLKSAVQEENNIVNAFTELAKKLDSLGYKLDAEMVSKNHNKYMKTILNHIEFLKQKDKKNIENISIFIGTVLLMLLLGVFLFFYLIKITHRISGPIFVMKRYLQTMIEGKSPEFRPLRDGDEFSELFDKVKELADVIKKRDES